MANKAFNSDLIYFSEHPASLLEPTSLDLRAQYELAEETHPEPDHEPDTSLSRLGIKHIVLLTDDVKRVAPQLMRSQTVTVIPYTTIKNLGADSNERSRNCQLQTPAKFIKAVLFKVVHVCITEESLKNANYISFIQELLRHWNNQFGEEVNKSSMSVSKIYALLLDDVTTLPDELKELSTLRIQSGMSAENIADFLESRERERCRTVESIMKYIDCGPRMNVFITPRVNGLDNEPYIKKSYEALLEVFEDAGSYPRQQMLQLLHIPNVQSLRSASNPAELEACIEIAANTLEDYLNFLLFYHRNEFRTMVQNNLKVNGQLFVGDLKTRFDPEEVSQVLKYFSPVIMRRHARQLKELIKEEKLNEVVKVVKSECTACTQLEDRVLELSTLCSTILYSHFIEREDLSPFEYIRFLQNNGCPDFLTKIRVSDGYNALHLAVKHERSDFMRMLFYTNKWGTLRNDTVKPLNVGHDSLHVGYTPRRLAEALSFRTSGYDMLLIFDEYDRYIRHMPAIHKACLMGSLEFTSVLIEAKPNLISLEDEYKATCLMYACGSGNADHVKFLLERNACIDKRNRKGETPVHIAALCGHLNVMEVLYKHTFDIRGRPSKDGYNGLYYCVESGDLDGLKLYKRKGFRIDEMALTIAAKHRQSKAFDFILNEVKDVNKGFDDKKMLPLHYSVINGNVYAMSKLLERGADIRLVDQYNKNVLHHAAEHGHTEILKILIDEAKKVGCLDELISAQDVFTGRDLLVIVRGKDRGRKAWHWVELKRLSVRAFERAMKSGQVDVINYGRILISGFGSGPDKKSCKMMKKRSNDIFNDRKPDMRPLHTAAIKDHTEVVKILIANGATPDARDYSGATALHYAAMNDNIHVMKILTEAGASSDIQTDDGKTPFRIAEENANLLSINFLQAAEPVRKARRFHAVLLEVSEKLSLEQLQAERRAGVDIRRYFINSLRELTIDINQLLSDLDSGPIQEVTEA